MGRCMHRRMGAVLLAAIVAGGSTPVPTRACGGFFCTLVPIVQTAEQIIFRQDGSQITAVVQIQYQGAAEDFSWVVPVPGVPQLSTGSDLLFTQLERQTRPQFRLEIEGDVCPDILRMFDTPLAGAPEFDDSGTNDVDVLQELVVGPFDVQIVTSDNSEALATWLVENGYDLSDRGSALIDSYVAAGMNFVALRLRQDQGVGDIEPLTMVYESTRPMIPIRLTAIAANDDLGLIVWLLGDGRAIPANYHHVTPNYARLNWYNGVQSAYASYQTLITEAMDDVGGQGFATDYAGRDETMNRSFAGLPDDLRAVRDAVAAVEDPAESLARLINNGMLDGAKILEIYRRVLPLPDQAPEFTYNNASLLRATFDAQTLSEARTTAFVAVDDELLAPLSDVARLFADNPYVTRFYTTLSADEMTLDPEFDFKADLPDRSLERSATLAVRCNAGLTEWSVTLGPGTGRDGEVIITGNGSPPVAVPPTLADQSAVKQASLFRELSGAGDDRTFTEEIVMENGFALSRTSMFGMGCMPATLALTLGSLAGIHFARPRRRSAG